MNPNETFEENFKRIHDEYVQLRQEHLKQQRELLKLGAVLVDTMLCSSKERFLPAAFKVIDRCSGIASFDDHTETSQAKVEKIFALWKAIEDQVKADRV